MTDFIVTGASRGIGRALAVALAQDRPRAARVFALARSAERLSELALEAGDRQPFVPIECDLASLTAARDAGLRLRSRVSAGAVLIHNAGVWPAKLERRDGLEVAFLVNCLAPLVLQAPLLEAGLIARVLLVGAGLMAKGRFDARATPVGADFSRLRTYCTTKLAGAVAMREVAARHPNIDFAVCHPGVVETELGASGGLWGALVRWVKRRWEKPATCAARLLRLLDRPRWQARPGVAPWFFEEVEMAWPPAANRDAPVILEAVRQQLALHDRPR